jgi:hypothetical protein
MFFSAWLRNRKSSRGPRRQGPRFRPRLEALDDRWLPSTLTVTSPLDDGSSGTLRAEIAAAARGDTIVFANSLNGQTITLIGNELGVARNLDIEGPGAAQLAISGNHLSRVFEVWANTQVTLAGLTIRDGSGSGLYNGGGLFSQGTVTVSKGGGLYNAGAATVQNTKITNNSAGAQGGGIFNDSTGTLTLYSSSVVSGNSAPEGADIDNFGRILRKKG